MQGGERHKLHKLLSKFIPLVGITLSPCQLNERNRCHEETDIAQTVSQAHCLLTLAWISEETGDTEEFLW